MGEVIKRKVAELEGAALDWAVTAACWPNIEGVKPEHASRWLAKQRGGQFGFPGEASDYMIEELVWSVTKVKHGHWLAVAGRNYAEASGGDYRQACMRAIVASELGEEVEIPEELV